MLTPPPVQSAYQQYENWAQNGMWASMSTSDADTRICEDKLSPLAGIGFGLAVSQGTLHGDRSACLGTLSGLPFVGITLADPTLPNVANGAFTDRYADGENMNVAIRGDIWVIPKTATAITAGGKVYFDATTGQLSAISSDVLIEDARWLTGSAEAIAAPWAPQAGFPENLFCVVRLGASANVST
jgi:predicted RecA/RadA family phage recombinase